MAFDVLLLSFLSLGVWILALAGSFAAFDRSLTLAALTPALSPDSKGGV